MFTLLQRLKVKKNITEIFAVGRTLGVNVYAESTL